MVNIVILPSEWSFFFWFYYQAFNYQQQHIIINKKYRIDKESFISTPGFITNWFHTYSKHFQQLLPFPSSQVLTQNPCLAVKQHSSLSNNLLSSSLPATLLDLACRANPNSVEKCATGHVTARHNHTPGPALKWPMPSPLPQEIPQNHIQCIPTAPSFLKGTDDGGKKIKGVEWGNCEDIWIKRQRVD